MGLILLYSLRNLMTRRLTTALTAGGMAMVVFVFATVLMLSEGLRQTLVSTGMDDNVVVIRKGSQVEVQSSIERAKASLIETLPEIATDEHGNRLVAREILVLIVMPRRADGKQGNVTIRGITARSAALRPQVRLIEGRMPREGSSELMVGKAIAEKFSGGGLGETLRFARRDWQVVGIFEAGNRAYSSEIWGDREQMMQAFRRPVYSSVIFRLRDGAAFESVKQVIESDPRLMLEAKRETRYYEEQSEMMSKFLSILGLSLSTIFSIGAVIGAMITMYAAVASRTAEIGTLRALGFGRTTVLFAFLCESLLLGLIGGIAGVFLASFMQLLTISTMNWQTFSELTFCFAMNYEIVFKSLAFSMLMGITGGLLPAFRAARRDIVEALRTA
jgi:ABC-type antimicrobial peptide transport system permease subunit